jgi:hypothetical protein
MMRWTLSASEVKVRAHKGEQDEHRYGRNRHRKERLSHSWRLRRRQSQAVASASRQQLLPYLQQLTPCTVGLETCPGAHYWARQIAALGHDVRLMPPQYVKPYVKRQKNDAADAEAICEAVTRPTMRFVAFKTEEQQAVLMLHRTRELLIRQKTMLINSLRGQLGELGIVAPQGRTGLAELVRLVSDEQVHLPALVRDAMLLLVSQLKGNGVSNYRNGPENRALASVERGQSQAREHSRCWTATPVECRRPQIRPRRPARRRYLRPHRDRQSQRHRSAGLAPISSETFSRTGVSST